MADVKLVIGFDLGHGESALARVVPFREGNPEPFDLGEPKSLPTVVTYVEDDIYIGRQAIQIVEQICEHAKKIDLCISFKARPSDMDPRLKKALQDFVRQIFGYLEEQDLLIEKECQVYVGCPSGWSDEAAREYEALLSQAAPYPVKVVRESRAALMEVLAKGERDGVVRSDLPDGVLVIDIGSSTTDFTYVAYIEGHLQDHPIDFGYDLGGMLIDRGLLKRNLEREANERIRKAIQGKPWCESVLELDCRRAKEKYYSESVPEGYTKHFGFAFDIQVADIIEDILQQPMPELGGQNWKSAFRNGLRNVRKWLREQHLPLGLIILTGGGSRMGFVRQICREVFPNTKIQRSSAPETDVAVGLARWGRVDLRTQAFAEEAELFIENDLPRIVEEKMSNLIIGIADIIADVTVYQVLLRVLMEWREGKIATLDDLNREGRARLRSELPRVLQRSDIQKRVRNFVMKWLGEIREDIDEQTSELCARYRIPKGSLGRGVTSAEVLPGQVAADVDGIEDPSGITEIVGWITAYIIYFIGVIIIADLGPIGFGIGLIVLVISFFKGKELAQKMMRGVSIPVRLRKWALSESKVLEKLEKELPDIKRSIVEYLEEKRFKEMLMKEMLKAVREAVRQAADRARLLIR